MLHTNTNRSNSSNNEIPKKSSSVLFCVFNYFLFTYRFFSTDFFPHTGEETEIVSRYG